MISLQMNDSNGMKQFKYLLWIIVLLPYYSWAGFSLSGSVITQTGTDTDLSGLSGVSGVTVTSQADIDVYNIGNRRLVIQGDLTIDPEIEMLIVGYDSGELVRVESSGHLTIGKAITQNGFTRYSEGMAIYLENTPSGFTNRFSFQNSSSLTWNGGIISIYAGKFGFYGDNVTVRINSLEAVLIYRTQDPQNQIRQETDDFISTAFSFINGDLTIVGTGQQLDGYQTTHCTGSIAFSGATPNEDVTFRGYSGGGRGNSADIKHWQGSRPILINSKTGSDLQCGPHLSSTSSYGVALVKQEFQVYVQDAGGTPLEGVQYFIRDTDNGNRDTYNKEGHIVNNTADNTYNGTTLANGYTATDELLLAANVVNIGNGDAPNTGLYAWDYRGKNNDETDLFDLHIWGYNNQYLLVASAEMKGVEQKVVQAIVAEDIYITEEDPAVTATLSGLSITHNAIDDSGVITLSDTVSLCDIYDYIKYNKLQNNLEEPSIGELAVTVSGDVLNVANYQLVINSGAELIACDKFNKIQSDIVSSITNPDSTLKVSLTDPNGTYRLIQLNNLDSSNFVITDEIGNTILAEDSLYTGTYSFINQTSSTNISVLVTRDGYTNWATEFDANTSDVFAFTVDQALLNGNNGNPATLPNQETELYLLRKLLQKTQATQSILNGSTIPNINLNAINQPSATNATAEKQDEMIDLLRLILSKSTAIRKQVDSD